MPTENLKIRKVYAIDGDKFKFRYCWDPRKGGQWIRLVRRRLYVYTKYY